MDISAMTRRPVSSGTRPATGALTQRGQTGRDTLVASGSEQPKDTFVTRGEMPDPTGGMAALAKKSRLGRAIEACDKETKVGAAFKKLTGRHTACEIKEIEFFNSMAKHEGVRIPFFYD